MILTPDEVRDRLRAHIAHCYSSQSEAARQWNVSPVFVCRVLKGDKPPTEIMLAELGLERAVIYRKREV